jgi:hypothetical protein
MPALQHRKPLLPRRLAIGAPPHQRVGKDGKDLLFRAYVPSLPALTSLHARLSQRHRSFFRGSQK